MRRDPKLFILDIIESIEAIEEFSHNISKDELFSSRLRRNAIIREIEIIGEAVKNLPESIKLKNKEIEWKKIAGMRDIITHGYFSIDMDAVWNAIKRDIPVLKKQIEKIKKDM
ncbi:MAG: HepT-like ribonuclease domain-containing protein [Nanoarchaeota archaeon]